MKNFRFWDTVGPFTPSDISVDSPALVYTLIIVGSILFLVGIALIVYFITKKLKK